MYVCIYACLRAFKCVYICNHFSPVKFGSFFYVMRNIFGTFITREKLRGGFNSLSIVIILFIVEHLQIGPQTWHSFENRSETPDGWKTPPF